MGARDLWAHACWGAVPRLGRSLALPRGAKAQSAAEKDENDVGGMTAIDARGFERQKGQTGICGKFFTLCLLIRISLDLEESSE